MKKADLDLYTDYLLSAFGAATGLSAMVEDEVSHDRITRLLGAGLHVPERKAGSRDMRKRVRQVFTNKDGSTGILHLVCNDLTCDHGAITTTCKKRWQVEVFHKSLKSNANLAKPPQR